MSQHSTMQSSEYVRSALKCVEDLLETGISENQLLQAADVLTASQYNDVVDERNIEHLCGYPLCDQPLVAVPKQKYHICSATNQVLDLTQRKKFCSSRCFKNSNYFSSQLSTLPPQARMSKRPVHLLTSSESPLCKPVAEVVSSDPSLPKTPETPDSPQTMLLDPPQLKTPDLSQPMSPDPPQLTTPELSQPKSPDLSQPMSPDPPQPMSPDPPQPKPPDHSEADSTNLYVQRISDSLDIWMGATGDTTFHPRDVLHPPLHDVCVTQVQRSLFLTQLRSALRSVGEDEDPGGSVGELASSFRLTNTCVTFRPPQWRIIVLLLIANCYGEQSVNYDVLDSSLKELKATREDFNSLLTKTRQLAQTNTDS